MSLTAIKQEDGLYIIVDEYGQRRCFYPYFYENGEWKYRVSLNTTSSFPVSDENHAEALQRVIRKEKLRKLLS